MTTTLCLSGAVIRKAGKGCSSSVKTEAILTEWINEAESFLTNVSKYDWVTNYAGLDNNVKLTLEEATSCLAGIYAIAYDMSGYTDRIEAQQLINILYERAMACMEILQEQDKVNFIKSA